MNTWEKISEKLVLKANIFKFYQKEYKSLDTGIQGTFDYLSFLDWVNIVAITKDEKIILIKQFRAGSESITIEIPGGAVDPGEDFLEAAKRELGEETGYSSKNWKLLGEVSPNPAIQGNKCFSYLALDCELTQKQNLDHLEEIKVISVPIKEAFKMQKDGQINHSLVVCALSFYKDLLT